MNAGDYFGWIDRHTRRRSSTEDVGAETEELAAPSEPIEVLEHDHASTTVIQRIRGAIARRFRSEP